MPHLNKLSSIEEKGKWVNIGISVGKDSHKGFDLIEFQELDDYSLLTMDASERFDSSDEESKTNTKSDKKVSSKKKKRKKKKKKPTIQEETSSKDEKSKEDQESVDKTNESIDEDYDPTILASSVNKKIHQSKSNKRKNNEKNSPKEEKIAKISNDPIREVDEDKIKEEMGSWGQFMLPFPILRALHDQGYLKPMPIQEKVLPVAIQKRRDVLGAAETGSGKTLAFGIPLVCHLLEDQERSLITEEDQNTEVDVLPDDLPEDLPEDFNEEDEISNETKSTLPALILAPTRELAIQVKNHLIKITKYVDIKVAAIVGGMAVQKQQRLLRNRPHIVIATPGRLAELIRSGADHVSRLHTLRYLVIDEADRMLEKGHFEDLEKIFEIVNSGGYSQKRQNFMFSATLTCTHKVSDRKKYQPGFQPLTSDKKLQNLSKKLINKKMKAHVVDLTTKKLTAGSLKEFRIFCSSEEKDFYLYYFIKSHPGRALIFVNSIDCIFRLVGIFEAINCPLLHIHGKMQQRQRLKHLDRFQQDENAVMIASDVAARGLDIPDVKHVIHYQVPRTIEVFVHRSGRCARSGKDGMSLLFVSPEEASCYRQICRSINKPEGLPDFSIVNHRLQAIKIRVKLAREVDKLVHQQKKVRVNNDWFTKMAEQADIMVDDDIIVKDKNSKEKNHIIKMKKEQLKKLLKEPVFPKGSSRNYITMTGKLQLPDVNLAS